MRRSRGTAPHKPLLLLAALGRIEQHSAAERLAPFDDYETLLTPLLAQASTATPRPEYPFVYAVDDHLWDVRAGTQSVSAAQLKSNGLQGGLRTVDHQQLVASAELRRDTADQLLEMLPSALRQPVVDRFGLLPPLTSSPPDSTNLSDESASPPASIRTAPDSPGGGRAPAGLLEELEQGKRDRGRQGELWIIEREKRWPTQAGRSDLAALVEHVADTADGDGYDIHSCEPDGNDRYIEVKTTSGGPRSAYFFTDNELEASRRLTNEYVLARVYSFPHDPKFYELRGPLDSHCHTRPRTYSAHPTWRAN